MDEVTSLEELESGRYYWIRDTRFKSIKWRIVECTKEETLKLGEYWTGSNEDFKNIIKHHTIMGPIPSPEPLL